MMSCFDIALLRLFVPNRRYENNMIKYNGVIFMCDYDTNSICLGDMTEPKKVLNISLPSGGSLRVNVDSVGGLSK